MLATTLNTNEIKIAAGTEIEFQRLSSLGRMVEYGLINEPPSLKHRMILSHTETGTGIKLRRRSLLRFNKTVVSTVDLITPCTISCYTVYDLPVGAFLVNTEFYNVAAELASFSSTLGGTTLLYDGTGNGTRELVQGGL